MSDFRQDIVSGDWIINAPERAKRPHDFLPKHEREKGDVSKCPFEDMIASGNWPPLVTIPSERDWRVVVIPNKYPALQHHHICAEIFKQGPYKIAEGVGHHELVVVRDHEKIMTEMSLEEGVEVFEAIKFRYEALSADNCVAYAEAFLNYGATAGASLYHPHYQVFGLPIVPPNIEHSLKGSKAYFAEHQSCPHCDMIAYEEGEGLRVVSKNAAAIAIAPFASHNPFEVRIYPRAHSAFFEKSEKATLASAVELLQDVLRKMRDNLNDPDLNFIVHTAPLKNQEDYTHYHWHIEILPKITVPGGLELGTGVLVNLIDPDRVAKVLRGEDPEYASKG